MECSLSKKSLLILMLCIIVASIFIHKSFYLDRLSEIDTKECNLQRRNSSKNRLETEMDSTEEAKPQCPVLPPDLGPYHVEVNVSIDQIMSENEDLEFGGHSKPENCTALQKIAIVIPFRNREPHLKAWLYNMHPFLQKQQADYGVYVVEQHGELTFNKARLMNAGFLEAIKEYDYNCIIFNDVDVIPMDQRNLYRCSDNPRHMSNALDKHGFKLFYSTAFGGIVAFKKEHFLKVNGFSNSFWGWGGEDDEFYQRVIAAGMKVERPDPKISKAKSLLHERDTGNERNPKNMLLVHKARERMHKDGLNSLTYKIISVIKHRLYTKIIVDIGRPD